MATSDTTQEAQTEAPAPRRAGGTEGVVERRTTGQRIAKSLLLLIIFVWCAFPFFWLIMTSFKQGNAALNDPSLFQGPFGLGNYRDVWGEGFGYNLRNSVIVAGATTIICISIGALAAYALARLKLAKKGLILSGVLAVTLFPSVALVPPLYEFYRGIGILNTYGAMYISYIAFNLPLTIFILLTFFAAIPLDMEEAARVDGATPFQAFLRVVMPLAAPGVGAAAILIFTYAWNEFLLASTFCPRSLGCQTVPTAIAFFSGGGQFEVPLGRITAASVIVVVPMIIFVLIFQKRIVSGLTAGGVKG